MADPGVIGTNAARRRNLRVLAAVGLAALMALAAGAAAVAFLGSAREGEPAVTVDLAKSAGLSGTTGAQDGTEASTAAPLRTPTSPTTAKAESPPPLAHVRIAKPVHAGAALVADPALIEDTAAGPLPRIGDDDRKPMNAYAPAVSTAKGARIAIVIGGLGVSAKATDAAIADLPAAVTLSFPPTTGDMQRWVNQARAHGHEVLIEVPMEPYDFPDSDPGPHALRAGAPESANIDRLGWTLARATGYAGVTNLLGSRFLNDRAALGPVMSVVARRGLLFFDSSSSAHSAAPDVASQIQAPFAQAYMTIDSVQTGMEIDRRLSELESRARACGFAAASGSLYPITIARVKAWAQGLSGRGFVLVPASAIVPQAK